MTIYLDVMVLLSNINNPPIHIYNELWQLNYYKNSIIETSKEYGIIYDYQRKFIYDSIRKLCPINLNDNYIMNIIENAYSNEQILNILQALITDSKYNRVYYYRQNNFIKSIVDKFNLVYDIFAVLMFSNNTNYEIIDIGSITHYIPDLFNVERMNNAINSVLVDNLVTLFHTRPNGHCFYSTKERNIIYGLLTEKMPEFKDIIEIYNKWLEQTDIKTNFYNDLVKLVFNNIRAQYDYIFEDLISDLDENVDYYIDIIILKNHPIKWS
jgi:hypothetical protein